MTSFTLTVAPAAEPVMLADAKLQARIDTTADDTLVTSLITAARQWAEHYTGRAFITQTWQLYLDVGPGAPEPWWDGVRDGAMNALNQLQFVSLPRPPLVSVNSVQYFDDADNATVWPSSNYYVDTIRAPGRIALRMGSVWPIPTRSANGIMIDYVAGYGDASAVPEQIKTAIRQIVSHWYENRGEASTAPTARGSVVVPAVPVPLVIQALLDPYRVRTRG